MGKLRIRNWNGRFYTSQEELNQAFLEEVILRVAIETTYGHNFTFKKMDGTNICTFYKDSTFGFSSQAFGVQIDSSIIEEKTFIIS